MVEMGEWGSFLLHHHIHQHYHHGGDFHLHLDPCYHLNHHPSRLHEVEFLVQMQNHFQVMLRWLDLREMMLLLHLQQ